MMDLEATTIGPALPKGPPIDSITAGRWIAAPAAVGA
jgi:hypothetical protein